MIVSLTGVARFRVAEELDVTTPIGKLPLITAPITAI